MYALDLHDARWRKSSRSTDNANCVEVAHLAGEWRKSTRSSDQANCVEIAPLAGEWRTSSHSANANCVEVAFAGPAVAVRDSKNTAGPALAVPPAGWAGLLSWSQER